MISKSMLSLSGFLLLWLFSCAEEKKKEDYSATPPDQSPPAQETPTESEEYSENLEENGEETAIESETPATSDVLSELLANLTAIDASLANSVPASTIELLSQNPGRTEMYDCTQHTADLTPVNFYVYKIPQVQIDLFPVATTYATRTDPTRDFDKARHALNLIADQGGNIYIPENLFAYFCTSHVDFDSFLPMGTEFKRTVEGVDTWETEHIAFYARALIKMDQQGTYIFRFNSDDGSVVKLDGDVLVDLDDVRGMDWGFKHGSYTNRLAGSDHLFELQWFQESGAMGMKIEWRPPDAADFVPIPPGAFAPIP